MLVVRFVNQGQLPIGIKIKILQTIKSLKDVLSVAPTGIEPVSKV